MLNHTNITASLWIMAASAVSLSLPACALQQQNAQTQAQNTSKAVSNYSDCSQINFNDIDSRELTREELIKRMDDDFEANLSKSEKCMAEAVASGAGRLGGAGGSGAGAGTGSSTGNSAAGSSNTSADSSSSGTDSQQSQQNQNAAGASSAEHQKGKGGQGSSSVCDAVKQGLTSATTDAEKQHFRGLMEQYGCK